MSKVDTQKIISPIMKFVNMHGIIALKRQYVGNFASCSY